MYSTNYENFYYFTYTADVNKICPQVTHLIMSKVFQVGFGNLKSKVFGVFCFIVLFCVLFVCKCVRYYS
jgi:hypothetical protein